jgi:hypothetical protein
MQALWSGNRGRFQLGINIFFLFTVSRLNVGPSQRLIFWLSGSVFFLSELSGYVLRLEAGH